jgi:hypothetical protein
MQHPLEATGTAWIKAACSNAHCTNRQTRRKQLCVSDEAVDKHWEMGQAQYISSVPVTDGVVLRAQQAGKQQLARCPQYR